MLAGGQGCFPWYSELLYSTLLSLLYSTLLPPLPSCGWPPAWFLLLFFSFSFPCYFPVYSTRQRWEVCLPWDFLLKSNELCSSIHMSLSLNSFINKTRTSRRGPDSPGIIRRPSGVPQNFWWHTHLVCSRIQWYSTQCHLLQQSIGEPQHPRTGEQLSRRCQIPKRTLWRC